MRKALFANPLILVIIGFMVYQSIASGRYASIGDWFISIVMMLPGIVIGLSFHEFAHALAADLCGDSTPRLQGRVTINPAAHIDPLGLAALLLIGFGWGRSVMIYPPNFKKPRMHQLIVACAGVAMNLFLAILFTGSLRIIDAVNGSFFYTDLGTIVYQVVGQIIIINLVLLVFNLLPIPPLDGFNIVTEVFRLRGTRLHEELYNKGMLILLVLIVFNVTDRVLSPCVSFLFSTIWSIFF